MTFCLYRCVLGSISKILFALSVLISLLICASHHSARAADKDDIYGTPVIVVTATSSSLSAQSGSPSITIGSSSTSITFNQPTSTVNDSVGQQFSSAQDWSGTDILQLTMSNPTHYRQNYVLLIKFSNSTTVTYSGSFSLPPTPDGQAPKSRDYLIHLLAHAASDFKLKVNRPALIIGYKDVYGSTFTADSFATYFKNVIQWKLKYMGAVDETGAPVSTAQPSTWYGARRFKQLFNMSKFIDAYGQFTDRSWPGKVSSDSALTSQLTSDKADVQAHPAPQDTAQPYSTTKPLRWEIGQVNGNYYFHSPIDGKYVWSVGMNAVNKGVPTLISGSTPSGIDRSTFFADRFTSSILSSAKTSSTTYNYHLQNLILTYGTTLSGNSTVLDSTAWATQADARLKSWGFNNIGISSDPLMYGYQNYTEYTSTDTAPVRLKVPTQTWEGGIPDPFDLGMSQAITDKFTADLGSSNADNKMMGIHVDNELPWGNDNNSGWNAYFNVPIGALQAASTQPAKIEFIKNLKTQYGTISALNTAWGTAYKGFLATCPSTGYMQCETSIPSLNNAKVQADMRTFITHFATAYFDVVTNALKQVAPGALYLGPRFGDFNQEVINVAENYVDVLSFNRYRFVDEMSYHPMAAATDPGTWWNYFRDRKKPVLFSEFGFTMQNAGGFGGGLANCIDSAERAKALGDFLVKARNTPNIIGVQYYAYTDEPMSGRSSDGENKNFSFTSITDKPDYDLVNEMRAFTANLYTCRQNPANCHGIDVNPIDTTPPTVSFATPLAWSTVGGSLNVTVNANDETKVSAVYLSVDGVQLTRVESYKPYEFPLSTTTMTDGIHTLEAKAVDTSGNEAKTSIYVYVVNSTTPVATILTPFDGTTQTGMINVQVGASDPSGLASIKLFVANKALAQVNATGTLATGQFAVNTALYANGVKTSMQAKVCSVSGTCFYSSKIYITPQN